VLSFGLYFAVFFIYLTTWKVAAQRKLLEEDSQNDLNKNNVT
jgi:hypothetical protein